MRSAEHCFVEKLVSSPVVQTQGHPGDRTGEGGQESPDRGVEGAGTTEGGYANPEADHEVEDPGNPEDAPGCFEFHLENDRDHGRETRGHGPEIQRIEAVPGKGCYQCNNSRDNSNFMARAQRKRHD